MKKFLPHILVIILIIFVVYITTNTQNPPTPEPQQELSQSTANTTQQTNNTTNPLFATTQAIVYKSPLCGCCKGHAEAMEKAGITVQTEDITNLDQIKNKYNIPENLQSCHTTIIQHNNKEYIVEGHIPIEGITKLLEETPDIPGIALPGMPIGTPGMPGPKTEPYNIMTLEKQSKLFLSI